MSRLSVSNAHNGPSACALRVAILVFGTALAALGQAGFVWDYTGYGPYSSYGTLNPDGWTVNGDYTFASPGEMIWPTAVSGTNPNDYEVRTTILANSPGGLYMHLVRETSLSNCVTVEMSVPSTWQPGGLVPVAINQYVSGVATSLGGFSAALHPYDVLRSVVFGNNLWVFVNNIRQGTFTIGLTTGQPGIGGSGIPSGSGFAGPAIGGRVQIGHHDVVAPQTPVRTTFASSVLPYSASLKWGAVADDSVGIGVMGYVISRNGTTVATVSEPEFGDGTVVPSTTYTYGVQGIDSHGNIGTATTISVTTPPASSIDPRRIGVYSNGSYWGGGGEQIDTRSGNLHFSVPMVTPQGRNGWTMPVNLVYDSQNWRQDSGTNWQLGNDVGYGFGWKLLIGSITPYYSSYWSGVDHYVYTDGTGAEYRLDQNSSGIWSSLEAVYVWFDANANKLHFKDGSFWVMGSTSGGQEADAGTMYPTIIEDRLGNQVIVTYDGGVGSYVYNPTPPYFSNTNTSSRIVTIEDVRGYPTCPTCIHYTDPITGASYTYGTYFFSYNRTSYTIPHLASFGNGMATSETGTFTYASGAQGPPFGTDPNYSGKTTVFLSSLSTATLQPYQFAYDSAGAGELASIIFPYGGETGWTYGSFQYIGSRTLREVSGRSVISDSAHSSTPWTYGISRPDAANSVTVHSAMTLTDASGVGAKTWNFYTSSTAPAGWQIGLASSFQQLASAGGTVLTNDTYTWSQDPGGHPYISAKTSVSDPGTGNQQSALTTQTLDQYGNMTQAAIYPYNNTSTPLRTYNNTYLITAAFTPSYIFNLLSTSTVTPAGGSPITLASNYYPQSSCQTPVACGYAATAPTWEYDAHSPVPFGSSGLLYSSTTNTRSMTYSYYGWGAVSAATGSDGTTATASGDSATNYAASQSVSVQSYNETISYNSWLGVTSQTGANGEQLTMTYDSAGRPGTATSPYGAVTTYAYPTVNTQTKTGPDGFTRTTLDGLGHTIKVERGTDSTHLQSVVDSVYAPCACSPLGKLQKTSQPYASGGSASNWTIYTYDGLGRTVSVQQPDGASTTTYIYSGNQTTVTDPAGKWKQFTSDVAGNLTTVTEPDPANPPSGTLTTTYTYDWMNHVTQVSMPRGGTTQTRTFVYNNAGLLTSATNPENGTVTYTYNTDNTLQKKHDARGQDTVYTYDSLKRVIEIQRYPNGVSSGEDICGQVNYAWGTDPTYYNYGRLTSAQSYAPNYGATNGGCGWANAGYAPYSLGPVSDSYWNIWTYDKSGAVTTKRFAMSRMWGGMYQGGASELAVYTYDTAGRPATVTYPMTYTDTMGGQPVLTMAYDTMGRPSSLTDSASKNWVSGVAYDFAGRMTNMTYLTGNPASTSTVAETMSYNAATGQMTSMTWSGAGLSGGLTYAYSTTQNNGQITQVTDAVSGETITYQYDALKRLTSAASTPTVGSSPAAWTQTYQYDGFGNLTARVLNGTTTTIGVTAATNQLSSAFYDANGNMTSGAGATITYDDVNRMATAAETSGGKEYYGYDESNKRVYRATGPLPSGQEQITFYGAYGEKLGVYSLQYGACAYTQMCPSAQTALGTSIWFAGRLVTDGNNAVAQDRLGTNRVSGARFYPYGEEITSTSNDRVKFGTYNRDGYTGLDYADQRFYASSYGRFNTPDPYSASSGPSNPGSWNRYSYTDGDPVNRFDPTGRIYCGVALAPGDEDTDLDASCSDGSGSGDMPQYLNGCTPYILAFGAQANSYGASLPDCENSGGYVAPVAVQPQVPTSFRFVGATPFVDAQTAADCAGHPFGGYASETFQVLNQFGQPMAIAGMQVQELIGPGVVTVGGIPEPSPGSRGTWYPANTTGPSVTNGSGQFTDAPFGGCSPVPDNYTFTQQYRVDYNNTWSVLSPTLTVSMTATASGLTVVSNAFSYSISRRGLGTLPVTPRPIDRRGTLQ